MKVQDYLVVEGRLQDELKNVDAILARPARLELYPEIRVGGVGGFPLTDENAARVVGSYLQDFYNCFENMAKTVARSIDGVALPQASDWLAELLQQVSTPLLRKNRGLYNVRENTGVSLCLPCGEPGLAWTVTFRPGPEAMSSQESGKE